MTIFEAGERPSVPHLEGMNTEVFKAFCTLLVAQGSMNDEPRLGYKGDQNSLFVAEGEPVPSHVFHIYAYPNPYTADDEHHLATLVRCPAGTNHTDLRYDLRATLGGGYVLKHDELGAETPDIDDAEKAELVDQLERFKDGLEGNDPSLAKQSGWDA